jgi:hypothetical protein
MKNIKDKKDGKYPIQHSDPFINESKSNKEVDKSKDGGKRLKVFTQF